MSEVDVRSFHFSLRTLLGIVALLAIGCAALKFAGAWALVLSALAMLLLMALAITAVLDRGTRQAFAIGFIGAAMVYIGLAYAAWEPNDPVYVSNGLPTSTAMRSVFELIVQRTWTDHFTGKVVASFDPNVPPPAGAGVSEVPDRKSFMRTAHVLWALLFGYLGGHFGQFVYA